MMRSLTVKWIGTLLVTSMIGVLLVGLFAYRATINEYDRLRIDQAQDAIIDIVTDYYRYQGTWDGIDTLVMQTQGRGNSPFPRPPIQPFVLADADHKIIIGNGVFQVGQVLNQVGTPITIDGEVVGSLYLDFPPLALDPREQRYIQATNRALLIGTLGASATAILIGMILSRHFLQPLNELTLAIRSMKQGDLEQQVHVRTQDELGELAQAFNQMSAEIHRVNQLRKQMTADVAHDLRTPLTVISGYLEALRDGTLEPTQERFDVMNQETALLRRLVDDLRLLSLADAGKLKLIYQTVYPYELLEQVMQSFQPIANERGVTIQMIADQSIPPIDVDDERMRQVLENLLSNAIRYTSDGGKVTLEATHHPSDPTKLIITVQDTGTGIPTEQLENIFERFYRIEASRTDHQSDSGLGLAIAKSIVEAHHGTITAQSRMGVGTTMYIELPIK
jgi:signal transduction histidine kinase